MDMTEEFEDGAKNKVTIFLSGSAFGGEQGYTRI